MLKPQGFNYEPDKKRNIYRSNEETFLILKTMEDDVGS
jgi:hypothetical protein